MKEEEIRSRLMSITALATHYCMALENCIELERDEFVKEMLG